MRRSKNKKRGGSLVFFLFGLCWFCFFLPAGCATAPVTGRTQLMMIDKNTEIQLGNRFAGEFFNSLSKQGKIIRKDTSNDEHRRFHQWVGKIYGKILRACQWEKEYDWRYVVVDDNQVVNAAMFSGGKMVVYSGIIRFAQSEDELAVVIAHEIAHGIARHGAERYSQQLAVSLATTVLDAALKESKNYPLYMAAIGLGTRFGILLPYSRLHEEEADLIGLLAMAKTGYRPEAALSFWERMEKRRGDQKLEFLSTHPSYGTRIKRIQEALPIAEEYRRNPAKPLSLTHPQPRP